MPHELNRMICQANLGQNESLRLPPIDWMFLASGPESATPQPVVSIHDPVSLCRNQLRRRHCTTRITGQWCTHRTWVGAMRLGFDWVLWIRVVMQCHFVCCLPCVRLGGLTKGGSADMLILHFWVCQQWKQVMLTNTLAQIA